MLLNVDLGELADEPEGLYACAHLANVACGGHAGDALSMQRALALCARHAVQAGAHPSFPDRAGFGRARMDLGAAALRASVLAQCQQLAGAAREAGVSLGHVKPHGALYHVAAEDRGLAAAVIDGALEALGSAFVVVGPAESALAAAAAGRGLVFAREGFADRGTRPDGTLLPRGEPGALLVDAAEVAERARALRRSGRYDTVCVHGDTPGAVALARAVRDALDEDAGA